MKNTLRFVLLLMIFLGFGLQSCEKKTENAMKENLIQKKTEVDKIPTHFKSKLRPNENIELGKIYIDTVKFINFINYTDDWHFLVAKNKDTIHLIYNHEDMKFFRGNNLEIKWKMDSMRAAGDSDYVDYREFLVSAKKLDNNISDSNFSDFKNQNFVISCGSGCAMTHNVKEIKKINKVSIEVTFDVQTYIDGEETETFDETYIFTYGNINTVQNKNSSEYIENTLPESAQKSFKDFGTKLFQSGILTD